MFCHEPVNSQKFVTIDYWVFLYTNERGRLHQQSEGKGHGVWRVRACLELCRRPDKTFLRLDMPLRVFDGIPNVFLRGVASVSVAGVLREH